MLNVINGHDDLVSIVRFLMQEALNNRAHSLQWSEGHPHRIGTNVRARQSFGVNLRWRFFIEPDPIQGLALKLLSTGSVGFESDGRDPARDVSDLDGIEQFRNAAR